VSHALYLGAQVILERVGCQTEENVNEPVVAHFRQKRLLVAKGVGTDDFRCGIRYLDRRDVFPRLEAGSTQLNQPETIAAAARTFKNPTLAFGCRG
jgi:hypothetical protein